MIDRDLDRRLKEMMKANLVVFFYINIINYLNKEQIEILIKKLADKTTKSNGEVLMDIVKKVDERNKKISKNDSEYFKKTWEK